MKIALIMLSQKYILVESLFTNLRGYWNPPDIVLEHWATGCKVEYIGDADYEVKKKIVLDSYNECIDKHYREFVY